MVHALMQTQNLIRPNGLLIDVHDLPTPHLIGVWSADSFNWVGWLLSKEDFASERTALNALAQIVSDQYFNLEDQKDFRHNIYVDTVTELKEWLAESWKTAVIPDSVLRRLEELTREPRKPTKIVTALQARMTKLRIA